MAKRVSFGTFQFGLQTHSTAEAAGPETPFRILVLSDLTGRANRSVLETGAALAARKPRLVDRDNFDELLEQLDVHLDRTLVDNDGNPVAVEFKELDDFHPDRLYESLPLFDYLRQLRRRLLKESTFSAAAEEVRAWGTVNEPPPQENSTAQATPSETSEPPVSEFTIEDVLGKTVEEIQQSSASESPSLDWQRLVADIVEPYVLPSKDPQQDDLVDCVDSMTARSMSALLQHRDFQMLEAAWRGLFLLVRRLETDSLLRIHVLDISREELTKDLTDQENLDSTGLYKLLVEQTVGTPGSQPWSLLAGNFVFSGEEDAELLGRFAKIAAAAGAPLVAGADGSFPACDSLSLPSPEDSERVAWESWDRLRQIPEAAYVGLLWPQFLLRLPYGPRTSPTDCFDFDETANDWHHGSYLWGNAAFAFALLAGQAFQQSGWSMRLGEVSKIGGLPVHIYDEDGEPTVHPCGERLLSERAIERVASCGLMPVVSFQEQDVIALGGVHSVAGGALRGRWAR